MSDVTGAHDGDGREDETFAALFREAEAARELEARFDVRAGLERFNRWLDGREAGPRERERLGAHLAAAVEALEGDWDAPGGAIGRSGPLTVTVTARGAEIRVRAEPGAVRGLPLALVERGVTHLGRLDASGEASFTVRRAEGARLAVPGAVTVRSGRAEAEALRVPAAARFVAADHGDAGGTAARLPGGQTVTVTEKRNRATGRMSTALVARSDAEADADAVLVVSLAGQPLAVPLVWRAATGRASGELRLGPPSGPLALAVVPEPVRDPARLDAGLLARSLERAADPATREALRRLLDRG
ncbi:hypothetical protein [Actinomadura miaoliensis]|uniref:Uncharacterized protein n=1 Tax=Actinomadura miaoliensis TaxID=430685 RepID=A0ABP7X2P9_9ACTN